MKNNFNGDVNIFDFYDFYLIQSEYDEEFYLNDLDQSS